jgi:acetyltransferase-like isoleucine patch superfamily enzyme
MKHITIDPSTDVRRAEITAEGRNVIAGYGKVSGVLHIGDASTVGPGAHLVGGTIRIGRYCQLGPNVAVYAINHPTNHLTSYVNARLFDGRLKTAQIDRPVTVGHDVWMGHGAILLPGVSVGDGAVIGAGAVVTQDVAEFTIVVGNPARPVRKRFTDELCDLVRSLKWWNLPASELARIEEIFHVDLDANPARGADLLRAYLARTSTVGPSR